MLCVYRFIKTALKCAVVFSVGVLIIYMSSLTKKRSYFIGDSVAQDLSVDDVCASHKVHAHEDNGSIPRILHYVYKDSILPVAYRDFIRKCMKINSDMKVIFWTDKKAVEFLEACYPNFTAIYLRYNNLEKSDSIRYFILYNYGGVYLDLDMECHQPLISGIAAMNTSCVLDQERPEQTQIIHNRELAVMNSAMACRARHPLFKMLYENLPTKSSHINFILHATGPVFLQRNLYNYHKLVKSATNEVKVANPEVFSPGMDDPSIKLKTICMKQGKDAIKNSYRYKACEKMARDKWSQSRSKYVNKRTLTEHKFLHFGYIGLRGRSFNISSEFPNMIEFPHL